MVSEAAVKADLFAMLDAVPDGYNALRLAIMEGRIDPMYPNVSPTMKRGCIKAHLAAYMGCDSWDLPGAAQYVIWQTGNANPISPAEIFIGHVRYMEKPATCPVLKTLIVYMDEWLSRRQQDDWMARAAKPDSEEFVCEPAEQLVELDDEEF